MAKLTKQQADVYKKLVEAETAGKLSDSGKTRLEKIKRYAGIEVRTPEEKTLADRSTLGIAYEAGREPVRLAKEGLNKVISAIPDAPAQAAGQVAKTVLPLPTALPTEHVFKPAIRIAADVSAETLDPINLLLGAVPAITRPKRFAEEIATRFPDLVKALPDNLKTLSVNLRKLNLPETKLGEIMSTLSKEHGFDATSLQKLGESSLGRAAALMEYARLKGYKNVRYPGGKLVDLASGKVVEESPNLLSQAASKIGQLIPDKIKQIFTVKGTRPESLLKIEEQAEQTKRGYKVAIEQAATELYDGLGTSEQQYLGRILTGKVDVSGKASNFRKLSAAETATKAIAADPEIAQRVSRLTEIHKLRNSKLFKYKKLVGTEIATTDAGKEVVVDVIKHQFGTRKSIALQMSDGKIRTLKQVRSNPIIKQGLNDALTADGELLTEQTNLIREIKNRKLQIAAQITENARTPTTVGLKDQLINHPKFQKLQRLSNKARRILDDLGSQAVDEGLIDKEVYEANKGTYMARKYRKYEIPSDVDDFQGIRQAFGSSKIIKGKQFKTRKGIDDLLAKEYGEIKEPTIPFAAGSLNVAQDVANAKMFKQISQDISLTVSDELQAQKLGFKYMGEGPRLGELSGKWVHPDVYSDIKQMHYVPSAARKTWQGLVGAWKSGKVLWNPATWSRNIMSDVILADVVGGVDVFDQATYGKKALEILKNPKSSEYVQAVTDGVFEGSFSAEELLKTLPGAGTDGDSMLTKAISTIPKANAALGRGYQEVEKFFKTMVWAKYIDEGWDSKSAAKKAQDSIFDYSKVSPAVKAMREIPFGSPFITFFSKAVPALAQASLKRPLALRKYEMLFDSINKEAQAYHGLSDEDVAAIQRNAIGKSVILPRKNSEGKPVVWNVGYIVPWGDLYEGIKENRIPAVLGPSGPMMAPAEVYFNKNIFTGKPLSVSPGKRLGVGDSFLQRTKNGIGHIYRSFAPPLAPPLPGGIKGGSAFERLKRGVTGTPGVTGAQSFTEAFLGSAAGIQIEATDLDLIEAFDGAEFNRVKKELMGMLYKNELDTSISEEEKKAYEKYIESRLGKLEAAFEDRNKE